MGNIEAAYELAAAGIPVFPCQTDGQTSDGEPLHKKPCPGVIWPTRATTRRADIDAMWRPWPKAAPGIHLAKTPYFVIDCDAPKRDGQVHGVDWLRNICEAHEFDLTEVPIVKTPSGGWHVYFRRPAGARIGNGRGSLPPKDQCGIDVRGSGGYVLGPGAEIDTGRYELLDGPYIEHAPLPPTWLVEILSPKKGGGDQAAGNHQKSAERCRFIR